MLAATAALLGLLGLLAVSSPALARSAVTGGITGSPQPELKPFRIGPSVSGGSVAIASDLAGYVMYSYSVAGTLRVTS